MTKFEELSLEYMERYKMTCKNYLSVIGISKSAYKFYKRGSNPSVDKAIRIARVLKSTVIEIWG